MFLAENSMQLLCDDKMPLAHLAYHPWGKF